MFSSSQAIVFSPLLRHFTNISLPLFIKDYEGYSQLVVKLEKICWVEGGVAVLLTPENSALKALCSG